MSAQKVRYLSPYDFDGKSLDELGLLINELKAQLGENAVIEVDYDYDDNLLFNVKRK